MKIGLLTQEYHTGDNRFGGVGRAFAKIAHGLVQQGHEVTVYVQDRSSAEVEERPGLRIVRVAPRSRLHWRLRALIPKLPAYFRGRIWHREVNAALEYRILQDYRGGRIEVLLTNRGVTAPVLMVGRKLPNVVRLQYSRIDTLRVDRAPVRLLDRRLQHVERRAVRNATCVYAPSKFVADHIAEKTGRSAVVIPTPMFNLEKPADFASVKANHALPDRYALYWGSFRHCKGVKYLADAIPGALAASPGLHMVMVGSREQRDSDPHGLEPYILSRAASCRDRLHLLPSLDQPELFAIIRHARLCVLPSILDNLPNTLLEAMHFGRVVVATRGASLDEVIEDGRDGFLVPPRDAEALAEAMSRAAGLSDEERTVMGRAAAEKIAAVCDPERAIRLVADLCRQAVETWKRNAA